jgi:predicted RNase H-like HicB family nuclease
MVHQKNPQVLHPLTETDLIQVNMEWDETTRVWVTFVPSLNNISTFGKSYEEALDKTAEAILLYLDVAEEHGDPIPLSPRKRAQLRELLA